MRRWILCGGNRMNKHQICGEIWYRIRCPKCKEYSFYNNGDPDDLSISDIEGYECPYCNYQFTDDGLETFDEDEMDYEIDYTKGRILNENS